jgi:formylglycine-generating enzyme required for sulfatase activity
MVLIPSLNSCIDQYEASGGQVGEARSIIGTLPWKEVSWFEARVACELAGKRLCEPFEWAQACQGTEGSLYPYGSIYEPDRCYGADRSGSTGSYQDPVPTGSMTDCEGGYSGLFDMSGNLWEWTADCSGDDCQMRGGSYQDVREDLLCESTYTGDGDRAYLDTGFRCCLSL